MDVLCLFTCKDVITVQTKFELMRTLISAKS